MTTREIDERIAAALERVAANKDAWIPLADTLRKVAAELRAAEPASEPEARPVTICGVLSPNSEHRCVLQIKHAGNHESLSATWRQLKPRELAPAPSLVERLREVCRCQPYEGQCVQCAAADAIESAQAFSACLKDAQADTRRLDAIIADVRRHIGSGWFWNLLHAIHRGDAINVRQTIDAATMERKP